MTSFGLPAKPPLTVLVVEHRPEVVPFPEIPPVHVREVEFGVDRLPDHEIREAFGAGLHHQVGFVGKDEFRFDLRSVDLLGRALAGFDLTGERADRPRELAFPAEADTDLDRRVGRLGVLRPPDGDPFGSLDPLEFGLERRRRRRIEHAHVDGDALGVERERPVEGLFQPVVRPPFEEVALGEHERDVTRRIALVSPDTDGEIPVVETHVGFPYFGRDTKGGDPCSGDALALAKPVGTGAEATGRVLQQFVHDVSVPVVVGEPGDGPSVSVSGTSGYGGGSGPRRIPSVPVDERFRRHDPSEKVSVRHRNPDSVTGSVSRASAFALVGSLSLLAPVIATLSLDPTVLTTATVVPFAMVALLAAFAIRDGPVFELFARPGDRRERRLYGLAGFALATTALAILLAFGLPVELFTASVCLLVFGNLGAQLVGLRYRSPLASTTGFVLAATVAGIAAQAVAETIAYGEPGPVGPLVFFATAGALIAAQVRAALYEQDDPLVLLTVGLALWLLTELDLVLSLPGIVLALGVTVAFGTVAYALGTASVTGMLTGIVLGLLTVVLGGYAWFVVLIAFYGVGGLSTKFRYEEKLARGVAEENDGARGSGNVLSNSAVALAAVVGYAATPTLIDLPSTLFLFAFAGALSTALADTLSSEIGGVYDEPRLITTGRRVAPGTDGAVTWQGELAGLAGASLVAFVALVLFDSITPVGALVVCLGGVAGMTADSLLGATLEGAYLGNQGVNFLATVFGALFSTALWALLL